MNSATNNDESYVLELPGGMVEVDRENMHDRLVDNEKRKLGTKC